MYINIGTGLTDEQLVINVIFIAIYFFVIIFVIVNEFIIFSSLAIFVIVHTGIVVFLLISKEYLRRYLTV